MLRATEKRDLVRLISYIALSGLIAPVLGPPVGGAITTYRGWRWIFFLNVPLGLIGIRFALALISDDRAPSVPSLELAAVVWTDFRERYVASCRVCCLCRIGVG